MTANDSPRHRKIRLAAWALALIAVVGVIVGFRGTATPLKTLFVAAGFFGLMTELTPPSWLRRKTATVAVSDPEFARVQSVCVIVNSFMCVVWGTVDKEPWQLDLFYFLTLGFSLIVLCRVIPSDKLLGDTTVGLDIANSTKESSPQ
jgi:hypothetical protein